MALRTVVAGLASCLFCLCFCYLRTGASCYHGTKDGTRSDIVVKIEYIRGIIQEGIEQVMNQITKMKPT